MNDQATIWEILPIAVILLGMFWGIYCLFDAVAGGGL
jgi:hypothetical protein